MDQDKKWIKNLLTNALLSKHFIAYNMVYNTPKGQMIFYFRMYYSILMLYYDLINNSKFRQLTFSNIHIK